MRAPISLGIGPAEEFKIAVQLVRGMSFDGAIVTYRTTYCCPTKDLSILSTAQSETESPLQKITRLVFVTGRSMGFLYGIVVQCRTNIT